MIYAKKGMLVRLVYLLVAMIVWILSVGGRLFSSGRVILCYHGITGANAASFRKQMQSIAARIVALDVTRKSSHPEVVITFDDAFENLLCNAVPVIDELQIPVSIYVVTGCMGEYPGWLKGSGHHDENERLMTSEQIKDIAGNTLISIGSHTHTHPRLSTLDSHAVESELTESRQILESLIGCDVRTLAFPHGAFNKAVVETANRCGLNQLLTLEEQMVSPSQETGLMGRFSMEPNVWPIEFRLTVDGAYAWLYYFRRFIRTIKKAMGRSF